MKKIFSAVLGGCLLLGACAATEQKTITIKGKVQFPDNSFNMEIVERNGFDKTIIDSCKVNEDGTYRFTMKVDRPGVYTLDCQKWQSVQFWAEDEDLEIDFRGMDTARIKIKEDGRLYYYDEDGYKETNTWKKRNGAWFYLDEEGEIATNQRVDDYFVNDEGHMAKNQWVSAENAPGGIIKMLCDYERKEGDPCIL